MPCTAKISVAVLLRSISHVPAKIVPPAVAVVVVLAAISAVVAVVAAAVAVASATKL